MGLGLLLAHHFIFADELLDLFCVGGVVALRIVIHLLFTLRQSLVIHLCRSISLVERLLCKFILLLLRVCIFLVLLYVAIKLLMCLCSLLQFIFLPS